MKSLISLYSKCAYVIEDWNKKYIHFWFLWNFWYEVIKIYVQAYVCDIIEQYML